VGGTPPASREAVGTDLLECAARLHVGKTVSDQEFDAVYADKQRSISFRHWTPVIVASRAACLLTGMGATRILDVGSGVGKFCIVGALATPAQFSGIEHRANLVEIARSAAARFGAERTRFVHGNIVDFDCAPFDGFYIYNPFQEVFEDDPLPIDDTVERSPALYRAYIGSTTAKLIRAPGGTAVVTFNGFGGQMPPQYRRVRTEHFFSAELVLWVRNAHAKILPRRPSAESASASA
jgi:SAM-dependent methyltransferase